MHNQLIIDHADVTKQYKTLKNVECNGEHMWKEWRATD
jgi:hypothetical protein